MTLRPLYAFLATLIAWGAWVSPSLEASPAPDVSADRELVSFAANDSYPYSYRNERGEVEGFAIDLSDAVARVMKLKIKRVYLSSNEMRQRFANGQGDLCQMLTYIPERESFAAFSVPFLIFHGSIFVRRGETRFRSMAELLERNARIASPEQGYAYALAYGIPRDRLIQEASAACIRDLQDGKVDVALLAQFTGLAEAKHMNADLVVTSGAPIEEYTVKYCFTTHVGDSKLLEQLNEGLAIINQSGEFGQIYRKWFGSYDSSQISTQQIVTVGACVLALGLGASLWGLLRQRQLRKRLAEQAEELAQSKGFLAEAQRFARIGHWQYRTDREPKADWSDEAFRIMGCDPRGPAPSVEAAAASIVEADRAKWIGCVDVARVQGVPFNIDVSIQPDRSVRRTVNIRGRALRGPGDVIVGVFGVIQDVTTWRAAEIALRDSEQLLRALYDNMPQALGVVERSGSDWPMVSLNPAASRLLARADAVSSTPKKFADLGLAWKSGPEWTELLEHCIETKQPIKLDTRSLDGRREMALTLVPLDKANNRPRCCFLVDDVTDRKQKDAEISQGRRLRAIGELVGGIAHEFNNLLTPILLKSEQLREDWIDTPSLAADLKIISEAATRSADLTRRLLTFGRKDEGRPEWIDLQELIRNNIEFLRHTIDRRIRIVTDIPATTPPVFLSGWDLHQILLNLLLNARDALIERLAQSTDAAWEPCIWITAAVVPAERVKPFAPKGPLPQEWVRLTIRDNGKGMPSEVLERVFEPFFTTKPVGSGTGLGLATTWHMVAEFGGRIDVESAADQGTAFHVSLPGDPNGGERRDPPPAEHVSAVQDREPSLRILLAEDEDTIARLMQKLLRGRGHAVTVVTAGSEAWAVISKFPQDYDLIVMDLNMPGLTGLELARKMSSIQFPGAMMVMTGRVTDEDRLELERLGVKAIVQKPFTVDEFLRGFFTSIGRQVPKP